MTSLKENRTSISVYVEQVLRDHLELYKDNIELWRKLWSIAFTERKPVSCYRIQWMQ